MLTGLIIGVIMGLGYSINRYFGMILFIIIFLPGLASLNPTSRKVVAFFIGIFGIFLGEIAYLLVFGVI